MTEKPTLKKQWKSILLALVFMGGWVVFFFGYNQINKLPPWAGQVRYTAIDPNTAVVQYYTIQAASCRMSQIGHWEAVFNTEYRLGAGAELMLLLADDGPGSWQNDGALMPFENIPADSALWDAWSTPIVTRDFPLDESPQLSDASWLKIAVTMPDETAPDAPACLWNIVLCLDTQNPADLLIAQITEIKGKPYYILSRYAGYGSWYESEIELMTFDTAFELEVRRQAPVA